MNEYPEISLDLAGEEFIATPQNAHFYSFVGKTVLETGDVIDNASRNHIFLKTGETYEDEQGREVTTGTYIFGETAQRIGAVMLHLKFPADLHRWSVSKADEDAYQIYIDRQEGEVPDFPPNW